MRPQLIPEQENQCLSAVTTKMLYECMEEEKVVDPVKLDLCDYQAIKPVHPFAFSGKIWIPLQRSLHMKLW